MAFQNILVYTPKLTLKSIKNGKSPEQHLALCANFEKDVENFSTECRAAYIVTNYIKQPNAGKRDVDGDSIERSF